MDLCNIGNKIRNFRVRSGKTQFEIECQINASTGSLSKIENGKINPTKETIIKISEALNLSKEEIIQLFNIS